jgi:hypothetical protein
MESEKSVKKVTIEKRRGINLKVDRDIIVKVEC